MVVLVRHAERAAEPKDDPGLTEAGAARARALAAALADAGVTAIITSDRRRTRDTAAPLAAARAIAPEIVAAGGNAHAEAVAAAVRTHRDGAVLVVGHSNTVPAIIAALGGPQMPNLCDGAYADLFILTPRTAGASLVRSKYGAPDPPGAAECR
jgi:broad specificity phosphatase PhoE